MTKQTEKKIAIIGGGPTGIGVGRELIEAGYLQNAADVGEYTLDALEEIQMRHAHIGDVRGKGLMIGIDFVKDKDSREPHKTLRDRIEQENFHHGLVTLGCGKSTIRFAPALNITKDEIDEGLQIFEHVITKVEQE